MERLQPRPYDGTTAAQAIRWNDCSPGLHGPARRDRRRRRRRAVPTSGAGGRSSAPRDPKELPKELPRNVQGAVEFRALGSRGLRSGNAASENGSVSAPFREARPRRGGPASPPEPPGGPCRRRPARGPGPHPGGISRRRVARCDRLETVPGPGLGRLSRRAVAACGGGLLSGVVLRSRAGARRWAALLRCSERFSDGGSLCAGQAGGEGFSSRFVGWYSFSNVCSCHSRTAR